MVWDQVTVVDLPDECESVFVHASEFLWKEIYSIKDSTLDKKSKRNTSWFIFYHCFSNIVSLALKSTVHLLYMKHEIEYDCKTCLPSLLALSLISLVITERSSVLSLPTLPVFSLAAFRNFSFSVFVL